MSRKDATGRQSLESRKHSTGEITSQAAQAIKAVLDAIPHGFVLWDPDLRFLLCNSRHLTMYGIAAERAVPGVSMTTFLDGASLLSDHAGAEIEASSRSARGR